MLPFQRNNQTNQVVFGLDPNLCLNPTSSSWTEYSDAVSNNDEYDDDDDDDESDFRGFMWCDEDDFEVDDGNCDESDYTGVCVLSSLLSWTQDVVSLA